MPLKTLVFSDIHGHDKGLAYLKKQVKAHQPGIVLIAGDATDYNEPNTTLEFLNGLGTQVLLVPGNMDRFGLLNDYKNIHNIHGTREEIGNVGFIGFGAVHMGDMDLVQFLAPLAKPGDVLLTHFPSKGYNDLTHSCQHAGSNRIGHAVRTLGFRLHISGHIHESPGIVQDQGVYYVNPGPAYEHNGLLVTLGEEIQIKKL